ncbi:MAG TPA: amidohydrolase family protein [Chloroflexota bacterium]|nr:amidohydrolase family protein [Chloroflexota bacterium]
MEQRFPRRDELDQVSAGHPVLLQRGGHNVVANSRALELIGIEPDVSNPPGGTFVRDAGGSLTGHAIGAAAQAIRAKLPDPPERVLHDVLLRVERAYNAAGITSVIDPGLSPPQIQAHQTLASAGQPTVRASLMWRLDPGFDDQALQSALAELQSDEIPRDLDDPWARILAIKLGVDGGVEAGYYREPYLFADDPGSPRGKPSMAQANLEAFCVEAARLGWQVGAHCLGDAAVDATLSAYEAANQVASIAGRRWTLIHMMVAREDHWARANRLGLVITAQQPLLYTLAEGFLKYIGPDRTRDLEPLQMYLARSAQPVGGGSDSPVTPYEPLLGIWSSVTRQTRGAGGAGPRVEDHRRGGAAHVHAGQRLRCVRGRPERVDLTRQTRGPGRAGRRPAPGRARGNPRYPRAAHARRGPACVRGLSIETAVVGKELAMSFVGTTETDSEQHYHEKDCFRV